MTLTIEKLNQLPDDERRQIKLDYVVDLLQGESGNSAAGILISVLAQFAITVSTQQGFDPFAVLLNINKAARDETRKTLATAGIRPASGKPDRPH